ncbi:MAG: Do family serine endopeptidase [Candidatus Marinimicrobia bacterium]|nr:Do family serine endopeptidase [Candidatus Neomarinimicrobiota bacterium]MBL7022524.1 Do family serine endopeptidase [Candidatus Neomarinimicrobiota bacterium]MBL7108621.1 Do family serine endopeptidase [Candidatus Neomarinimicrobiota bacterium]
MKKSILTITGLFLFSVLFSGTHKFNEPFIKVSEIAKPSVVSIVSEQIVERDYHNFFLFPFGDDNGNWGNSPWDQYSPKEKSTRQTLGSGVIIDSGKGYIITNNHVIEDAEEITVILYDKQELEAEIVGSDPLSDIAIIKIETDNLTQAELGNSDNLQIGEWVIAIGSPFGLHLNHTVTAGIVSAQGRSNVISKLNYEDFIQHDAAINPGNSGGALMNLDGELIGINTAIATGGMSRANAGVGFAIPINQVKRVIEDLIKDGKVSRGWLGVSIQDIDKNMAKVLNLNNLQGAIITQVLADSPAEKGGFKEQDVIIQVGENSVNDASHLKNLVATQRPNKKVKFLVIRNGNEKKITIKLADRPKQEDLNNVYSSSSMFDKLGLKVENIDDIQTKSSDSHGVIITDLKQNSSVSKSGIRKGDLIIKIGSDEIKSVEDYKNAIELLETGDSVMLLIQNASGRKFVGLEID